MTRAILFLFGLFLFPVARADWPTYMGNPHRLGVSDIPVVSNGKATWIYRAAQPPSPGFYPDLKNSTLGPQRIRARTSTFDIAFAPVISDGRLFFGSSTDGAIRCLDAKTGAVLWTFFTDGPVRLAPTVWRDRVLAGSDDGGVTCLDAATGKKLWRFEAAPEPRRIIAHGRLASQWPVRTGVAIDDGTAYFAAGLFPASGGVKLFAIDANTGTAKWEQSILLPPQGYILVDGKTLYVPNGRASPAEYSRVDGKPLAETTDLRRQGGSGFVSMLDDMLVYGPNEYNILRFRTSRAGEGPRDYNSSLSRAIHGDLTGIEGWRIVESGEPANRDSLFFLRRDKLIAIDAKAFRETLQNSATEFLARTKNRVITVKSGVQQMTDRQAEKEIAGYTKWTAETVGGRALVMAGDTLFVGAESAVYGFDAGSGSPTFKADVNGTAWELALDDGALFVSTDTGEISCFIGSPAKSIPPSGRSGLREPGRNSGVGLVGDDSGHSKAILKQADVDRGFCLLLGAGDGHLATELARDSAFKIHCVERSASAATAAREALIQTGLYGDKVTIALHEDGALPYAQYFANLIVAHDPGAGGFAPEAVRPLLQPFGGTLILVGNAAGLRARWQQAFPELREAGAGAGLVAARRGPLQDAGEWTHMFADPANTSCSGDNIVGGTKYRVQWFGDPGPNVVVGWHSNGMGPLYKDGRLYMIKVNYVETVDAYNGTSLWRRDVPGSMRFSPGREGGSVCVDDDCLYFAVTNNCRVLDAATGDDVNDFTGPDKDGDWGYVAVVDNLLLGSKQSPDATLVVTMAGRRIPQDPHKSMWGASEVAMAMSRLLFALDRKTGETQWTYGDGKRVIVNSSITVGDGRIYFVESRKASVIEDADASVLPREFVDDAILVALDIGTGRRIWEQPLNFPTRTILYLSHVDGRLVAHGGDHRGPLAHLSGSTEATSGIIAAADGDKQEMQEKLRATPIHFMFKVYDAGTGAEEWSTNYPSMTGIGHQHNYNNSHPILTEDFIWHAPAEQQVARLDLRTGEIKKYPQTRRNKGCATPTGSARAMFYRSLGIASFDFEVQEQLYVSRVNRPSCWMSLLPAGGVLQMPEYSIGCNCAFPIQTSIVLQPVGQAE